MTVDTQELRLGEAMARIKIDETGLAVATNLEEQVAMAAWAVRSGLLPEAIKTTAQAWIVMRRGAELGFPLLTAFEFLYVVKGQVRLKPDGAKAKALSCGLLEDYLEEIVGEGEGDKMCARVTVKRRGMPKPVVGTFSVADAKTAELWGKRGPGGPSGWVTYPKRMLLARAKGFAYSDCFKDIIGGLPVREAYDLDPGEWPADREPVARPVAEAAEAPPPAPVATPDPLLSQARRAPAASSPEPVAARDEPSSPRDEPGASRDEPGLSRNTTSDEVEKLQDEPVATCDHRDARAHAMKRPGILVVCTDCGAELKVARSELPISHGDAEPPPDWRPGGAA